MNNNKPTTRKYQSYSEKLRDTRWQQKRLELLKAADWQCQSGFCECQKEKPVLEVHHKVYFRNANPWDYPDWAYSVLCEECHERAQKKMETIHAMMARNDSVFQMLEWMAYLYDENQQERIAEAMWAILECHPKMKDEAISQLSVFATQMHRLVTSCFLAYHPKNKDSK